MFFLFSNRYNEFIQKRGNTTRINNLNSIPNRQYPIPNGQYPTPNGQYPTKRQHTVLKNCRSHFRVLAPEASGLREIKYNLHIPTKKLPCISKHISNTN